MKGIECCVEDGDSVTSSEEVGQAWMERLSAVASIFSQVLRDYSGEENLQLPEDGRGAFI